jgi:hypothetical protein
MELNPVAAIDKPRLRRGPVGVVVGRYGVLGAPVNESQLLVAASSTAAWRFLRGTDTLATPAQLAPLPSLAVKAIR